MIFRLIIYSLCTVELTICLITKGRLEYLDQLLASLKGVSKHDWVKILIILNGAEEEVAHRIYKWAKLNSQVEIESREVNDVRPSILWPLVRRHTDGWCLFISDDDVFCSDILPKFQEILKKEKDLVAITALAEVINAEGLATGEIKRSTLFDSTSKIEAVAKSLNAPPFPWPTLFFDVSKLPAEIPNSRYVFDWWVGIQLVLSGKIGFLDEICVQYRSHPQQESHLASHRRKYFEAFIWFEKMIQDQNFSFWINSLSEDEKVLFWKSSLINLPIYGDAQYSSMLLNCLRSKLGEYISLIKRSKMLGDFAFLNGVPLKNEDLGSLLSLEFNQIKTFANVELEILPKTCGSIYSVKEFFTSESGNKFQIACKHSKNKTHNSILVNCDLVPSDLPQITSDLILFEITKNLEKNGEVSLVITPKEKNIVLSLRRIRMIVPNSILNLARKLLS